MIVEGKLQNKLHIEIEWQQAYNALCGELGLPYLQYDMYHMDDCVFIDNGVIKREDERGKVTVITDDAETATLFQAMSIIKNKLRERERNQPCKM